MRICDWRALAFIWAVLMWALPVHGAEHADMPDVAVRGSTLTGHSVQDGRGQKIAEIDDVIIDGKGRISQVVLATDEFLGIKTHLVSVPFDALLIHREWKYRTRVGQDGSQERVAWKLKWRITYAGEERLQDKAEYHYPYENPRGGTEGWGVYSFPEQSRQ